MKSILIVICLIVLASCSAQKSKKITFKTEDSKSLVEYLGANNVKYEKNDIAILNGPNTFGYYNNSNKLVVPDAYFFNKEGNRVADDFQGEVCGQIIKNIEKLNEAGTDKPETINDWVQNFTFPFLDGPTPFTEAYDGFVIINWAKFAGKEVNSSAFNWYNSLKKNKELTIKVILVNLDIQSHWKLNDNQKSALGLE